MIYDSLTNGERRIDRHLVIAETESEDETRTVTLNFPNKDIVYYVTNYDGEYLVVE